MTRAVRRLSALTSRHPPSSIQVSGPVSEKLASFLRSAETDPEFAALPVRNGRLQVRPIALQLRGMRSALQLLQQQSMEMSAVCGDVCNNLHA